MTLRVFIPAILSGLFFASCNSSSSSSSSSVDSVDNVVKTQYTDGTPRAEVSYKNGKKNGKSKHFYQTGKLFEEIEYKDGLKHGLDKKYYEDGTILQETPYDSNRIHGIQKKYRKDGKLASEMPFFYGNECVGVKEYLLNGTLKEAYPSIVIQPVDKILTADQYKLVLSMSDEVREVTYYEGKLVDGKYIGKNTEAICCTDKTGKAELIYYVPSGDFLMKEISIIAKVKTFQGNYFFTQRSYNLAVENRY